jgi:glucan phosphoethanolaminetransferase (alkaline phosphatase superfamily)
MDGSNRDTQLSSHKTTIINLSLEEMTELMHLNLLTWLRLPAMLYASCSWWVRLQQAESIACWRVVIVAFAMIIAIARRLTQRQQLSPDVATLG